MALTKEQHEGVFYNGSNILIAAAAGSGKTKVLTERVVETVSNPDNEVNIDELLVLTYTKAASLEMKERISKVLASRMEECDDKNMPYISNQMSLLAEANITTVHSFCMKFVKRHFNFVDGLSPKFRIVDPSQAKIYREDLLTSFFDNYYLHSDKDKCDKFKWLLRIYCNNVDDSGLKKLLLSIYDFAIKEGGIDDYLGKALNLMLDREILNKEYLDIIRFHLKTSYNHMLNAIAYCDAWHGPEQYSKDFQVTLDKLEQLLNIDTYEELYHSDINPFGTLPRKTKDDDPDVCNLAKEKRDTAKKAYQKTKSLMNHDFDLYMADMEQSHDMMVVLFDLVREFANIYQEFKLKKAILEFSDLELYTRDILRNNPKVAKSYQSYFKEILIDEYQDINPIQEEILNLLSNGKNLFVVGDVKQSIYGFRSSKPQLFMNRYDTYHKDESNDNGRKIILNKNFRSRYDILEFANFIFSQIMQKDSGDVDYTDDEKLVLGGTFDDLDENNKSIEIHLTYLRDETVDYEDEYDNPNTSRSEARLCARKVLDLIEDGYVSDGDGGTRKVKYSDIAVLMRSPNNKSTIYEDEFRKLSIPVMGSSGTEFFKAQEIRLFMSLLSIIDNPNQDIPLAAVLRSYMFDFTEEEIAIIRLVDKRKKLITIMKENHKFNDSMQGKIDEFLSMLQYFRRYKEYHDIVELIDVILAKTDYQIYLLGLPNGNHRINNINTLRSKAIEFLNNGEESLFNFLRYLKKLLESEENLSAEVQVGNNTDAVLITSIHKSKGLEFPIVILSEVGKQFNKQDTRSSIVLHGDYGMGTYVYDMATKTKRATIMREIVNHHNIMANTAEEMRLLYVALTRPKDKLIIVGSVKNSSEYEKYLDMGSNYFTEQFPSQIVMSQNKYLVWILLALSRHSQFGLSKLALPHSEISFHCDVNEALGNMVLEDMDEEEHDMLSMDQLVPYLDYQYGQGLTKTLPTKISVTEYQQLLQGDVGRGFTTQYQRPHFISEDTSFSGAELGTLYHKVMSLIPFDINRDLERINEFLDTLVAKKIIKADAREAIDCQSILDFLDSDIGNMLRLASSIRRELSFTLTVPAGEVYPNYVDYLVDASILLQGAIDLIYQYDDKWYLVDYKTDKIKEGSEDILRAHYREQLSLYCRAVKDLYGINVDHMYIYTTKLQKIIEI